MVKAEVSIDILQVQIYLTNILLKLKNTKVVDQLLRPS